MKKDPEIDRYLANVLPDRRSALQELRKRIHSIVPGLAECISYKMPAFRFEGQVIAGFAATSKGCSYFPFSGSTLRTLRKDLATYSQTKSALHFTPEKRLPATLVRKLLRARIAELK
ncbi:MAG: DUF1801 domain-containing protein [Deltaproteobacteria bacterium]|nr:DUF1801 domain-containing protein [Deltaproteobacteria bacterium]